MNRIYTLLLLAVVTVSAAVAQNKPFVIPELREWSAAKGELQLTPKGRIVALTPELLPVAEQLSAELDQMFGMKYSVTQTTAKKGDIVLEIGSISNPGDEAYTLLIGDRVAICANQKIGAYWATRSLLQLLEQSRALPCGIALDYPSYAVRGFMLDVARKPFSLDFLQKYVKFMSYYKMNTFQIHLNDNGFKQFFDNDWNKTYAAFRLESETYPGLAAKDVHYTKKQFRDLQIMAEAMGVTIIPEIDAPAHTLAFAQYKPEVGSKDYGMDHLDLFNPETYKFMDNLFKEYISGPDPVFRGKYVHIGTDEYSNKDSVVVEKFRYFTDHYINYVESFGKKAMVWGALTHAQGTTRVKVKDVLMGCWYNGYADPRKMVELGYDVVSIPDGLLYIVPAAGYYYDYLNCEKLYESWTPAVIGKEVFEEQHPQIKGGMFAVWNDHVGNGISYQDVHHRVLPAMQTLSVKMWDGTSRTLPWEEFDAKRLMLSDAPGLNMIGRTKTKGEVLKIKSLKAGDKTAMDEIGYDYRVEFDLMAQAAMPATRLFESENAIVWLTDPKSGKLGFSRDGYDFTFNYVVPVGKKVRIAITGDNKSTALHVDGQQIDKLEITKREVTGDKGKKSTMSYVKTLVFPLAKVGSDFKGQIENLTVTSL